LVKEWWEKSDDETKRSQRWAKQMILGGRRLGRVRKRKERRNREGIERDIDVFVKNFEIGDKGMGNGVQR